MQGWLSSAPGSRQQGIEQEAVLIEDFLEGGTFQGRDFQIEDWWDFKYLGSSGIGGFLKLLLPCIRPMGYRMGSQSLAVGVFGQGPSLWGYRLERRCCHCGQLLWDSSCSGISPGL